MSDKLVIIPTYNEKENIVEIIHAVQALNADFDVLIIDDNSPDGTASLVKELINNHYPNHLFLEERKLKDGLGRAYIHGFKWALEKEYNYIFEMDADFSHNPKDLIKLYQTLLNPTTMMSVGSRYSHGVNVVNWDMKRVLLSFFASKYVNFFTGLPIHDATAGFVGYKKEVLQNINLDKIMAIGYGFQVEMKYRIWQKGYKIIEVPIIFTDRTKGQSKMHGGIIKEAALGVIKLKILSLLGKLN